jgi:hypothetical protein
MKNSPSHVHARSYFGESTAQAVLEWLNTRSRRKSDHVEKMLLAFADLRSKTREFAAVRTIRSVLRESKLRLEPFWFQPLVESQTKSPFRPGVYRLKLDPSRSVIEWDPVSPRMSRAQAIALHKLLDLASQGLVDRVRQCKWQECERWFFARFSHQECCSGRCQQNRIRSTDEWKKKRKIYMQRHRRQEKGRKQEF